MRRVVARLAWTFAAALAFGLGAPALAQEQPVERAPLGMVVSEDSLASRIGRDVLVAGGNAVDAAVATGFALAVTHPAAGNIGGGGFMVIRLPDGRATAVDFRERAPADAHPEMFLVDGEYSSERHHDGYLAVGVPGTVAGFEKAWRLYGRSGWAELVSPAVDLAARGFRISERLAGSLAGFVDREAHRPTTVAAFSRDGEPYAAGDVWRQPDLARSLTRILEQGSDGFYRGETATLLVEEMRRGGGLITLEDLRSYQARERAPIRTDYRGYDVISMPPPSSGGVALAEMLEILEGFDLRAAGAGSPEALHLLAEAMRRAYRDRATYLADVDHVDVPVRRLTSEAHAAALRATIDPSRASASSPEDVAAAGALAHESPQTTHYSVVDAEGMAVAVTYTLEQGFGSGITVEGGGFLLNNEMGDFNAAPGLTDRDGLIGTEPNLARPGQRMLSSMTPTIVAREGRLVAVIGSPGGRAIINTVLQLVLNRVDFGMSPAEVVAFPRIHHPWLPDRIVAEETVPAETLDALRGMGHAVRRGGRQGLAHSIFIDARTGERVGVPDPRNPYAAAAGH